MLTAPGYSALNKVTQITSLATGVTLNANCGQITTVSATVAGAANTAFTVTNSYVGAGAAVVPFIISYGGTLATNGFPYVTVGTVAAGSFVINVSNVHASNALSGVLVIGFFLA